MKGLAVFFRRGSPLSCFLAAVLTALSGCGGNGGEAARQQAGSDASADLAGKPHPSDAFDNAWAEDVLEHAVKSLAADYGKEGKGDYRRVLYGRLCEGLTIAACAEALDLKPATIDNYYRHARDRLSQKLRDLVVRQVSRYSAADELEQEVESEWQKLGRHLREHGGLEAAVRRAHQSVDFARSFAKRETAAVRPDKRHLGTPHSLANVVRRR